MEPDALVFMVIGWGFPIGILTFCIAVLFKHPIAASPLTGDGGKPNDYDSAVRE